MEDYENFIAYTLFFIGILITLLIPLPIKEEYRLFIITAVLFSFVALILSDFNKKLNEKNRLIDNLNQRFKTLEDLNNIRLDIKDLQREVFKK